MKWFSTLVFLHYFREERSNWSLARLQRKVQSLKKQAPVHRVEDCWGEKRDP